MTYVNVNLAKIHFFVSRLIVGSLELQKGQRLILQLDDEGHFMMGVLDYDNRFE